MTFRLRKHANCRNNKHHITVVDLSAINYLWGFIRAIIVITQRNTIKREIVKLYFIINHSTVDSNKSSSFLSIFKLIFFDNCYINAFYQFFVTIYYLIRLNVNSL